MFSWKSNNKKTQIRLLINFHGKLEFVAKIIRNNVPLFSNIFFILFSWKLKISTSLVFLTYRTYFSFINNASWIVTVYGSNLETVGQYWKHVQFCKFTKISVMSSLFYCNCLDKHNGGAILKNLWNNFLTKYYMDDSW